VILDVLTETGSRYKTDKIEHGFCSFYHHHLAARRDSIKKVLEIGVQRGASLLMWRDYFLKATVHGLDISPPQLPPLERIQLHTGDQSDRRSLQGLLDHTGSGFDLIVDDGGHTMRQQQVSFGFLFPHLRPGGIFIIEDLHTSFKDCIVILKGGRVVDSYATGVGDGVQTTYQIVEGLVKGQPVCSEYMLESERTYIDSHVEDAVLFDRDGDHEHITSVIHKR